MTATDAQVRIAIPTQFVRYWVREREKDRTQEQAAASANLRDRKTVGKYERLGKLPSEVKRQRTYRTRSDPFETDWSEVEAMMECAPGLEAKTLFEWLCERHPGKYQEGQLRTLQRRVSSWRALNGTKLLTLEQVHRPGEVLQTDGTWMNKLGITTNGQSFPHMVLHSVLPHSRVRLHSVLELGMGSRGAVGVVAGIARWSAERTGEAGTRAGDPSDR